MRIAKPQKKETKSLIQNLSHRSEESMLASPLNISSSCSGCYTSDMTMAVIEKSVNDTKVLDWPVIFRSVSCHDPQQKILN